MGATTYAVPAIVVLISWLLLDEVPAPLTSGGGLLRLVGVTVPDRAERPSQKGHPPLTPTAPEPDAGS